MDQKGVYVPVAQAHVVFKPTLQQQRKCANCTDSAIDGTFTVAYDVNRDGSTGELQVGGAGRFQQAGRWRRLIGSCSNGFCPPGVRRPLCPVLRSDQPLAAPKEHRVCHRRQRLHVGRQDEAGSDALPHENKQRPLVAHSQ